MVRAGMLVSIKNSDPRLHHIGKGQTLIGKVSSKDR